MNEYNITRFEVSNFKKFDHLVVENMGQVNLITGDNNVGKTTLLEALLFNENNLRWIGYLHQTLFYRGIHINSTKMNTSEISFPEENFIEYIFNNLDKPLIVKYDTINLQNQELKIEFKLLDNLTQTELLLRKDKNNITNVDNWLLFSKNGIPIELQWLYFDDKEIKTKPIYWPYIGIDTPYGNDLRNFEQAINSKLINGSEKKSNGIDYYDKQNIIKYLKILIDNILDYQYLPFGSESLYAIATSKDGKYHPLTTFGDGIQKFFRYVFTILFANKIGDTRILIDEIDTGVHFTKMKDEWKAIFELSKQTGVQIFATTHSMDCINAFVEAAEESEDIKNDLRLIKLEEFTNNVGKIKNIATSYTHSQLEATLYSELNVRGGKLW